MQPQNQGRRWRRCIGTEKRLRKRMCSAATTRRRRYWLRGGRPLVNLERAVATRKRWPTKVQKDLAGCTVFRA